MPLLWPRTNTSGIHKILKNTCDFVKSVKPTSNCIPDRSVSVCKDQGGTSNELSTYDVYSPVFWICGESQEINMNASSGNRIFKNDNRSQGNDLL